MLKNLKCLILNNLQVLYEYNKATGNKNEYLSSSTFRSAMLRKNMPKIETIISLCNTFNIDTEDFLTKPLELRICIKGSEVFECDRYYKSVLDKLQELKEGK